MERPSELKLRRLQHGLSQEQLAVKAGVSQTTVSFVERGIKVSTELAEKVVKALDEEDENKPAA
jgi:transcriptional regulator with XRE-family HTH domain